MAKFLGIDVGGTYVRAVLLRSSYRRITLEAMAEAERTEGDTLGDLVRRVAGSMVLPGESLAVNLEGERTFLRRIPIPAAAQKQLSEVLPFELEAELPFELTDAVYDHAVLQQAAGDESVSVLAVVARTDDVRDRINLVREALNEEPERVAPGAVSLASLSSVIPELMAQEPVAVLDLEASSSELVVLERGEPVFARTLSRGTAGLPESAPLLARALRQSIAAFRSLGGASIERIYLVGAGASAPGAFEFFQGELGVAMLELPPARFDETPAETLATVPRFAKAVSLALALTTRSKGFNLRRGALAYERGFGFLREKIPLLSGLGMVIAFSFLFSTWAEFRALNQERTKLESALDTVTKDIFGEGTSDPQRAMELLDKTAVAADDDPLPHTDAFDVLVQLSQAVPIEMTHDIEELDVQRGHVTVHGIVPSIPDAQQIAAQLKTVRCFSDVKIVRTNQELGSDRQKYAMEFDLKCPVEGKDKAAAASPSSSASSGAGGKP